MSDTATKADIDVRFQTTLAQATFTLYFNKLYYFPMYLSAQDLQQIVIILGGAVIGLVIIAIIAVVVSIVYVRRFN